MGCGSSKISKDQKLLLMKKNSEVESDRAEAEDQTAPLKNNSHCKDQTTTDITTASYSKTEISKELPDVTNITAKSADEPEIKRLGALGQQNDLQQQQIGFNVSEEKPANCSNHSSNQGDSSQKPDKLNQKTMSDDPNSNHEASQKPNDLPAAELVKDSVDPRLETFVTNGENLLDQLNNMPMTLDDMPMNYQTARAFRQLYHKARYNISKSFCRTFLDKMLGKGLIPCFVNAFQKIQRQWPHVFNEIAYQDEVTAWAHQLSICVLTMAFGR